MRRSYLERFIQKYYLGGNITSVMWESNGDGTLSMTGKPDSGVGVAFTKCSDLSLPKGEYAIHDTSELKSLLNVLEDEVEIGVASTDDGVPVSLLISDKADGGNTDVKFMLSDPTVIGDKQTEPPLEFEVSLSMDKTFRDKFIKAASALSGVDTFTITPTDAGINFIMGQVDVNTSNISLGFDLSDTLLNSITFSTSFLKEVFSANKNVDEIKMDLTSRGVMRVTCTDEIFDCTYYLLKILPNTF
jgi:hypothetical protein